MFKSIASLMILITVLTLVGYGQTTPVTPVTPVQAEATASPTIKPALAAIPAIPDADKKELDRLYSKRQLAQEQANRIQLEYDKAIKDLSDQFNALSGQLSQTIDRVYVEAKVTKDDFNVDVINGTFVPVDKTKK